LEIVMAKPWERDWSTPSEEEKKKPWEKDWSTQQPTESTEELGFIDRAASTLSGGLSKAKQTLMGDNAIAEGQSENIPSDIRQRFGDVTEGERLGTAGRVQKALGGDVIPAAGEVIADIIPESVKAGLGNAMAWMKKNKSESPRYAEIDIAETIGPEASTALSEIANIGSLVAPVPKLGKATFGDRSALKKAVADTNRRARGTKKTLDPDIIDPLNTEVSPSLKNYENIPSEWDQRMIDRVNDIDDFNPDGNMVENIQAIDRKNKSLATKLKDDLADAPLIDASEIDDLLKSQIAKGEKNFLLTGDAGTAAGRIYNMMDDVVKTYIKDGKIAPVDLLSARQQFDNDITGMSKGIFDPATTTANKVATRDIRRAINERVAQSAPEVDVLDSLSHQSDLYGANEVLIPRAQKQSKYGLGRAVEKVETDTGLAPARTPLAAASNVTSPLASAVAVTGSGLSLAGRKALAGLRSVRTAGAQGGQGLINATLATLPPAERAAILAALQEEENR
jgi:hypothetical protein